VAAKASGYEGKKEPILKFIAADFNLCVFEFWRLINSFIQGITAAPKN